MRVMFDLFQKKKQYETDLQRFLEVRLLHLPLWVEPAQCMNAWLAANHCFINLLHAPDLQRCAMSLTALPLFRVCRWRNGTGFWPRRSWGEPGSGWAMQAASFKPSPLQPRWDSHPVHSRTLERRHYAYMVQCSINAYVAQYHRHKAYIVPYQTCSARPSIWEDIGLSIDQKGRWALLILLPFKEVEFWWTYLPKA